MELCTLLFRFESAVSYSAKYESEIRSIGNHFYFYEDEKCQKISDHFWMEMETKIDGNITWGCRNIYFKKKCCWKRCMVSRINTMNSYKLNLWLCIQDKSIKTAHTKKHLAPKERKFLHKRQCLQRINIFKKKTLTQKYKMRSTHFNCLSCCESIPLRTLYKLV